MKVVGKYKTLYECDMSEKQKDGEGTIYSIKGCARKKVKLYTKNYCTREKEQVMNGVLTGETEWYGPQVLDIVYSHGRFAGYIYEETDMTPEAIFLTDSEECFPEGTPDRKVSRTGLLSINLKPLYTAGVGVLLVALTYFCFFDLYIGIVKEMGGEALADYCHTFNFWGITGIIGGIAAMFLTMRVLYQGSDRIYCMILPIAYLVGMAVFFLIVTLIIVLLQITYAIFVALIPSIIIILVIIYLIKGALNK